MQNLTYRRKEVTRMMTEKNIKVGKEYCRKERLIVFYNGLILSYT